MHALTKEAIVLSKMINPTAETAENVHTSIKSAGVVRRSFRSGPSVPAAVVSMQDAMAIPDAHTFVQI